MKLNSLREFEACFPKGSGCWIWEKSVRSSGYGAFRYQNKNWNAHRLAWFFYRGSDPGEKQVLHHCDVRACVNPEHLYLGDHADNMRDMAVRQRAAKGSGNGNSKLSLEAVKKIIKDARGLTEIALEYGITKEQVWNIRTGRQWRHAHG